MDDIDENEMVDELKRQNDWIDEKDNIKLKKVLQKKNDTYGNVDVIIEVNMECFDKMMAAGKIIIGWMKKWQYNF